MTYPELQEFTKQVVLKYLPQIVRAEENNGRYPEELFQVARGLNRMSSTLFITILHNTYQINLPI